MLLVEFKQYKFIIFYFYFQTLDLSNNKISRIDIEIFKWPFVWKKFQISNNPINCDCDLYDFITYHQRNFSGLENVTCLGFDKPLHLNKRESFCYSIPFIMAILFAIILLGTLSGLIAFHSKSEYFLDILSCKRRLHRQKKYDVFISYCHEDEDFVINDLVERLENGPENYEICIHSRDWLPGEWIHNNIIQSVEASRRTIIVLSYYFLRSVWGLIEFKYAHNHMMKEKRDKLIILVYGAILPDGDLDKDLKSYLESNTYIMWGDPYFWPKLIKALPEPGKTIFTSMNFTL